MKYLFLLFAVLFLSYQPAGAQSMSPGDTLRIASWNLQNFGTTKLNDPDRIPVIVDVIREFDIIAIQEVRDASMTLQDKLMVLLNADGSTYKYAASDRVGTPARYEQYLIYYDSTKLQLVSGTAEHYNDCNDVIAREPFEAMFTAGNFDFYISTIHTDPDLVSIEIPALFLFYYAMQKEVPSEKDIILLGDFNAKSPASPYESYTTLDIFYNILGIKLCIEDATNSSGNSSYDNIIFQSQYTSEYADSSGVYHYWSPYGLTEEEGKSISDHLPVFALFIIPDADDD